IPVGVVFQVFADRVIGGDRLWAGAERRFIRRQLEYTGDARCRASARNIGIDCEHAGTRLRTLQDRHFTLRNQRPVEIGRAPWGEPLCRVACLPTRAAVRTETPVLTSVSVTRSMRLLAGTDISSAALSKPRSGTAITSASAMTACAAAVLQPATRTLPPPPSWTRERAAAGDRTKAGTPAGWWARSMKGKRAMILGAE